ncbi:hypothetical protein CC2G_014764 [Coprinopsis cinerea AmutBmut pab1-1]|nr:hypothetical protein CC2G_014764 [Coprinopsis cinerea AmutBmut pab1-1]
MSPPAAQGQLPTKSKKEKERERREKAAQQQSNERLKTVVRRLPPNLPEDIFWQTVKPWVTEETATWKVYYPGKFKKRDNKENIPSRAYIAFKNEELLATFSREFDGHLFKDKAGNESYAIVEFAPYQKVPSEKRKPDTKNATIEKDDDYISFIESLNAATNTEPVTIDALLAATRPPSPPKTTPLLEALKAEKSAQKDKEAILRNHAHYKDQANLAAVTGVTTSSSRKEEKKKAQAAAIQAAQAQAAKQVVASAGGGTPATPSKKGKKGREAKEAAPAQKGSAPGKAANGPAEGKAAKPAPSAKQSRQQKAAAKAAEAAASNAAHTPQVTIAQPPKPQTAANAAPAATPAASGSSSSTAQTGGDAAPTPAPARRPRAVLGGRHFEAALAGVGARPKRERDTGAAASTATAPTNATNGAAPPPAAPPAPVPSSPVKEKVGGTSNNPTASPPRSRNRRGGGPAQQQSTSPTATKLPAILQRDAPATQGNMPGLIVPPAGSGAPTAGSAPAPGPSERGGRGGRGRSRGRGGPRGGARGG